MKYALALLSASILWMTACGGGGTSQPAVVTTGPTPPETFTIGVSVAGNGSVVSSPSGIACPGTCTGTFAGGTKITLTETPATGSDFSSWGGDCSGTGSTCKITLTADESSTATFAAVITPPPPKKVKLSVAVSGNGSITSAPAGINCPGTCQASYPSGSKVVLSQTASSGAQFNGWSGACTGNADSCTVTLTSNAVVAAGIFTPPANPQPVAQVRFAMCTTDGTPSYIVDADLDSTGTSDQNIVYNFPNGCPPVLPWDDKQDISSAFGLEIGPDQPSTTVNYVAPSFVLILGTYEGYQGVCNQSDALDCIGTFGGSGQVDTADQPLAGTQFPPLCSTCTFVGTLDGLNVSLTIAENSTMGYQAMYTDPNGSWGPIVGVVIGGTATVNGSAGYYFGDPALANISFFVIDNNSSSSSLIWYDSNGQYQGTLTPGGQ